MSAGLICTEAFRSVAFNLIVFLIIYLFIYFLHPLLVPPFGFRLPRPELEQILS